MEQDAGIPNMAGSLGAIRPEVKGSGFMTRSSQRRNPAFAGQSPRPSGSKCVQSMGDEDSDAQNNEKCCNRLEHGQFPRNGLN
jgi:hypothetical protein